MHIAQYISALFFNNKDSWIGITFLISLFIPFTSVLAIAASFWVGLFASWLINGRSIFCIRFSCQFLDFPKNVCYNSQLKLLGFGTSSSFSFWCIIFHIVKFNASVFRTVWYFWQCNKLENHDKSCRCLYSCAVVI